MRRRRQSLRNGIGASSDCLGERTEPDATRGERCDGLNEVRQRAAEAVELPGASAGRHHRRLPRNAADRWRTLHKFAPDLIEALEFCATRAGDPMLAALKLLAELNRSG